MSDLLFQNLSTAQDDKNALPNTIASAATITPVHKFTRVTGTTKITKITPPTTGYCEITLVFTTGATTDALDTGGSGAGAIAAKYTSVADRPITLHYDPRTTLWYPMTVA